MQRRGTNAWTVVEAALPPMRAGSIRYRLDIRSAGRPGSVVTRHLQYGPNDPPVTIEANVDDVCGQLIGLRERHGCGLPLTDEEVADAVLLATSQLGEIRDLLVERSNVRAVALANDQSGAGGGARCRLARLHFEDRGHLVGGVSALVDLSHRTATLEAGPTENGR